LLRFFDIELAEGEPDWWRRSTLARGTARRSRCGRTAACGVEGSGQRADLCEAVSKEGLYQEALRPQLHFSPRRGWNNDPNGLVYYNGEYHLFFQHNLWRQRGNMHWGHAVSQDLVHWTEVDEALYPTRWGRCSAAARLWTTPTRALRQGRESTAGSDLHGGGKPATQCLAYSLDGGPSPSTTQSGGEEHHAR
jgi:sucrose-6-phosphate hydrolase SacC (GH32 family)